MSTRAHLVAGGYPAGQSAGHDMDYARRRLLDLMADWQTTVSSDFQDLEKWLPQCSLLVTYVAGPFLTPEQADVVDGWVASGGRWVALHGTSGGKAARMPDSNRRQMVKQEHHRALGAFFLNHPPLSEFEVAVSPGELTTGVPTSFTVRDELYLIEVQDPDAEILLTTKMAKDPSPPGFGFYYDKDTSVLDDGETRVLGYQRRVGEGRVIYYALGHCHNPNTNMQPMVDASIASDAKTPSVFLGPWESPAYAQLLKNAIATPLAA